MEHQFLAIEGNIGAGKTSLCKMLADEFNYRLVLEQFSDNPFLPLFYENPERYAFTVELFFMSERYRQLQDVLSKPELFTRGTLADYFFIKTLLFAQKNLKGDEYRLFQRLFSILNAQFPKPDLLVYIHRPVEHLLQNIRKRGRDYEQEIPASYLQSIQEAYMGYFKLENEIPTLILDLEGTDFIQDPEDYRQIKNLLGKTYPVGVHRIKVKDSDPARSKS